MTYHPIDPVMWDDRDFLSLSDFERTLWIYLLTGPQVTALPGLQRTSVAIIADTMRREPQDVRAALAVLEERGMVMFDPVARVLRVPNAPKYNAAQSPNHIVAWGKRWREIPDCQLKLDHLPDLELAVVRERPGQSAAWERQFGALIKALRETSGRPSGGLPLDLPQGLPQALPNSESESEPESEPIVATAPQRPTAQIELIPAPAPPPVKADPQKPPFDPQAALEAIASTSGGRFVVGAVSDWAGGHVIAVRKAIRKWPDLARWRLVGEWLRSGGKARMGSLAIGWVASSDFADAMTQSAVWKETGTPMITSGAQAPRQQGAQVKSITELRAEHEAKMKNWKPAAAAMTAKEESDV
jgi:hypothetical protein